MALAAAAAAAPGLSHALARLVHHKAAAHRVVLAHGDFLALRVKRGKAQAVGVAGQAFAPQQQVFLFDPTARCARPAGPGVGCCGSGPRWARSGRGRCGRARGRPGPAARRCRCRGPMPVADSEPNSSATTWCTAASPTVACRWHANCRAAIMGPTVWELDGPMPILKRSKTLTDMVVRGRGSGCGPARLAAPCCRSTRGIPAPHAGGGKAGQGGWRAGLHKPIINDAIKNVAACAFG
jgi:hypothetical protein